VISPEIVYSDLKKHYGWQQWWPAETAFEIMVGAILTQGTSWSNVEKAIDSLKSAHALDLEIINEMPRDHLSQLIYSAGFHNVKPDRLKSLSSYLMANFDGKIEALKRLPTGTARSQLLAIDGIGPETADAILLYALGKSVFIVDTYTKRLFTRLGYAVEQDSYDSWQAFFVSQMHKTTYTFQQYHALIVEHSKARCKSKPICNSCPLASHCTFPSK
tara:strand:- start:183 stop:833 length:651 start_codon:yes stop_codon:yes gene_type:complete